MEKCISRTKEHGDGNVRHNEAKIKLIFSLKAERARAGARAVIYNYNSLWSGISRLKNRYRWDELISQHKQSFGLGRQGRHIKISLKKFHDKSPHEFETTCNFIENLSAFKDFHTTLAQSGSDQDLLWSFPRLAFINRKPFQI